MKAKPETYHLSGQGDTLGPPRVHFRKEKKGKKNTRSGGHGVDLAPDCRRSKTLGPGLYDEGGKRNKGKKRNREFIRCAKKKTLTAFALGGGTRKWGEKVFRYVNQND